MLLKTISILYLHVYVKDTTLKVIGWTIQIFIRVEIINYNLTKIMLLIVTIT